ncbi:MAG: PepSY domain-containing protein [Sphingosinicella sp.]|nr:PepSY domain-containing protein [Sphingosinicella sp.]
MKISPLLFRKIHKWVGLILGIQFLLWTISGLGMALLDHEEVSGGHAPETPTIPMPAGGGWGRALASVGSQPVTGLAVLPLLDRQVIEIDIAGGTRLFDSETGSPVTVDATLAEAIAVAAYHEPSRVQRVEPLDRLTLAVREHELPIWRVDFADERNSSFYVSGTTGKLLERRNDSWRLWDVLWMLHNMDYLNRTSFNHPLIVAVTFFTLWLAITGFYLLFATGWRKDLRWLRRKRDAAIEP